MLYSPKTGLPIGTCFGFKRSGLCLTASHSLDGFSNEDLLICSNIGGNGIEIAVNDIVHHEQADLAALYFDPELSSKYELMSFAQGISSDADDFLPTENVIAIGYPVLANEDRIRVRLMSGSVQSDYMHERLTYRYTALELPFPSFPGQSGSPLILDESRVMSLV